MATDQDNALVEEWCAACEDVESKLSDWEISFVASVRERINNGRPLTDTQIEKLEEIYNAKAL